MGFENACSFLKRYDERSVFDSFCQFSFFTNNSKLKLPHSQTTKPKSNKPQGSVFVGGCLWLYYGITIIFFLLVWIPKKSKFEHFHRRKGSFGKYQENCFANSGCQPANLCELCRHLCLSLIWTYLAHIGHLKRRDKQQSQSIRSLSYAFSNLPQILIKCKLVGSDLFDDEKRWTL